MTSADLLIDAFSRVHDAVHQAVMSLTPQQLAFRPYPEGNSIAWLVWHLSRIQDDHVAGVAGTKQVWQSGDWAPQFGLPAGSMEHGYGHTPDRVAAIIVESAEVLTAYYDAVHEQTIRFVAGLTDADLPTVVDERWDPPVTLAVRVMSVISDDLQHVGQAAFIRGIVLRR